MAKLTFVLEDGQEVVVPLDGNITLGRADGNDVVVDDNRISARHAELLCGDDGKVEVRDLDSKAGTFVNGERVQRRAIGHGDRLAFGPLSAVLDLEEAPAANGANGAPEIKSKDEKESLAEKISNHGKAGPKKKDRHSRKDRDVEKPPPSAAAVSEPAPPAQTPVSVPTSEQLFDRLSAEQKENVSKFDAEKMRLNGEVDAVKKALRDWQEHVAQTQAEAREEKRKLEEARAALVKARSEEQAVREQHDRLQAKLREAAEEMSVKSIRVEKLKADEQKLAHMTAAAQEAEAAHRQWMDAIKSLSAQHDQKSEEVQRLTAAASAALHEVESVTAQKEREMVQLREIHAEVGRDEARLAGLRQQVAEQEARSQDSKALADAREDQVKSAEKRLGELDQRRSQTEARIKELGGIQEKLEQALTRCREAESNHGALNAAIADLGADRKRHESAVGDLESRISALQGEHRQISTATDEARAAQQRVEEILHRIHAEREAHENDLGVKRRELISEMQRLDEAKARRAEIAKQCEELAGTEQKLAGVKQDLAAAEKQHVELMAAAKKQHTELKAEVAEIEMQRVKHKGILDDLCGEEDAAKGRIEVLRGREKDLRGELEKLADAERNDRERFEEIRRLASEAEKEHAVNREELARSTEVARRELADMEVKLAPLRDWKDSMDKRYARLAALPEDSAEARELWNEIEKEKANLKNLISVAPGQTRGVSLKESVLRGIVTNAEKKSGKGILHAPAALTEDAETPEQRANVGTTGTGAMFSGTGQEMALNARVTRLRESVQREAMRLEFLRQERAREETRTKSGPAGEAMMREQDRQLETKIRREEERFATLQRKLELAEVEEEKRREKIADMERKLAELRTDITEAERQRSDTRQQADLAQTELKNYEAAIDRVKKMAE